MHEARLSWNGGLAPGHERLGGILHIGGISAEYLAQEYGTPLLALDFARLDAALDLFLHAAQPNDIAVAYAAKALFLVAIARKLADRPIDIDVASLGELLTAERGGIPADRITLHGCAKTDEELDAALDGRAGRIVVDNFEELRRLHARSQGGMVDVLVRANTGIEAHTHEFIRTSGDRTKFGMDPDELRAAASFVSQTPSLRFRGVHSHIGSQIYERDAFLANVRAVLETCAMLNARGLKSEHAIVGGGFGVQMEPEGDAAPDPDSTLGAIATTAREEAKRLNLPLPRIGIEPGRAIVADAGTSLYRIVAFKRQFGRKYAIVDGSIADNPRPALYGAYHHVEFARERDGERAEVTISGRSCENDRLGVAALPADVRADDVLALCSTGAYTYSMASNYNRFPKPAVVAIEAGTTRLLARRELDEEVLRYDCEA